MNDICYEHDLKIVNNHGRFDMRVSGFSSIVVDDNDDDDYDKVNHDTCY